jgi:ribonuclease HI
MIPLHWRCRGNPSFSQNHSISFSLGLGEATNNFSEFMALYLILLLALENNLNQLNIYGDSLFVIQVMKGTHILHSYTLVPLLEEIRRLSARFTHITFSHVYRIHNSTSGPTLKGWLGPGQRTLGNQRRRLEWPQGIYSQPLGQFLTKNFFAPFWNVYEKQAQSRLCHVQHDSISFFSCLCLDQVLYKHLFLL